MLGREIDGLKLTFHLAGINNQNFLMRDEETGTYWQQISGLGVAGPLAGRTLKLISSDELTFALWKTEQPQGTVLRDVAAYVPEYAGKKWDVRMKKAPTVLSYARPGVAPRDLMVGIHAFGAARAFPYEAILRETLIQDRLGPEPILLVAGPDGESIRAFRSRIPGTEKPTSFYRMVDGGTSSPAPLLMDEATGSRWNFQGCAVDGLLKDTCLQRLDIIKDYWFDWRHYNPDTTVYAH